ncbi:MAG: DNA gyrase subunit A [Acidobacteria bacterium]|nr:MAG: DNA gyrase subunit A [Acidobacteriota bacterium]PYV00835.1 MAG: DNA gyrase subunit A [Acidobacteriota bacterium]
MPTALEPTPVNLIDEMRTSYLDYAMSVIIGRALPDARDGLKPVHRRVLHAMNELGNTYNKPYKKSARIVGDVIGKYHPHGPDAVYDTIVRMVQDFSLRYPLIDGQGNFGSVDGDNPAAMRYTEVRMARLTDELLADIEKETVDFVPNYDGSLQEPLVLPAKFPNLLVNGSSGIAVGMATNVPPHNMTEIISATIRLIENPDTTLDELLSLVPGPDFPTAGFIYGRTGIRSAYATGRGIITLRARMAIEKISKDREAIVVTEIPFQVNKAKLIERIAELVRDKRLDGISDIRDESDREGMRIFIELKKEEPAQVVMNNLYKLTPMQTSFGIILLTIVNNQPRVLSLKEAIECFIDHRKEVVRKRTLFDLKKAEARAHILEGLKRALDMLDAIIALIRASKEPAVAREGLITQFQFSEAQAQAILEMRLQRLTGLEREKIVSEYEETLKLIARLKEILASEKALKGVIVDELQEIQKNYGDARRTEIVDEEVEITLEDLIAEEDVVITVTHSGYIKRTNASLYRSQGRGGKGRIGMTTREEDFIDHVFVASTHSYLLIFTNRGQVYLLKVHEIPDVGTAGKGKAIVNLVNMRQDETIADILSIKDFEPDKFVLIGTRNGIVKKTALAEYSNIRSPGLIAITVAQEDEVIGCQLTDGSYDVLLVTRKGKAMRFAESDVRDKGRTTQGVIGIRLQEGDVVVGMAVCSGEGQFLSVTEKGFGKRTGIDEYPRHHRGGSGVINIRVGERNGDVVSTRHVRDDSSVMLVTEHGKLIQLNAEDIRQTQSRAAVGVKCIELEEGDKVVSVAVVAAEVEGENQGGE